MQHERTDGGEYRVAKRAIWSLDTHVTTSGSQHGQLAAAVCLVVRSGERVEGNKVVALA